MDAGIDIIGDVHGNDGALVALLRRLGYADRRGAWSHPDRTAIFVGDLIDRHPGQLEVLRLVRSMVDAGSARIVLGNHEFNAAAWATPGPGGEPCREHSDKNRAQHQTFLDAVGEDSAEHRAWIRWFHTIPLWVDLGGVRVVHACWDADAMATLEPHLTADRCLTEDAIRLASTADDPVFDALENILKGPEVDLGGPVYLDKGGHPRARARLRWWDPDATTLRAAAEIPARSRTPDGEPFPELPDTPLPSGAGRSYADGVPVLFGHYWQTGAPSPLSERCACVDYSAGRDGPLVAYRWDGEEVVRADRFVAAR